MIGKGDHQEKAGEDREEEEVVLLGVGEGDLVNGRHPAEPSPLSPGEEAGQGPPQDPVESAEPRPDLPLGDRRGEEELPEAKRREPFLVPGEDAFALPEHLNILSSDLHIHKTYGNAFAKTALEEELRKLGVDTVVITGFCAEYCVLSTCRGAADLDLSPILLRGSLASGAPENIGFVERVNEVVSYGALEKMLG